MDNPESRISAFLEGNSFKDLPGSVIHEAKRALLDTLGCIIAGVDTPLGRCLSSLCARFVDSNGSTVVGGKKRAAPFCGAMCNSYMAEQGIRGTLAIFDSGDKTIRIDQLGQVYEIEKRYYKPHPGCRWSHGPGQTLTAMVAENNLSAGDIETIEVATFEKAAQLDNPAPATMDEAEYSIPFILGAILADGCFGPDQMTRAKLSDPQILKQARKVQLKVKSEFDGEYPKQALADVKLTTREGLEFRAKSERSRGDWDYPLSDVQLEDKFRLMCANRLSRDQSGTVIDRIWSLEAEPSMRDFIAWINQLVCRH